MNPIFEGWKPVKDYNDVLMIKMRHQNLDFSEYYFSPLQALKDSMFYKEIDGGLFLVRTSAIMGNYSLIIYSHPLGLKNEKVIDELAAAGIQLRSSRTTGTLDGYKEEFIYSTDEFIKRDGSQYRKHRHFFRTINPEKCAITHGINGDLIKTLNQWSEEKNRHRQIKLFEIIRNYESWVTITNTYYCGVYIGFSIVEMLNPRHGIILQRIINPRVTGRIEEPNFLLHYNDCVQFPHTLLNIGGASNDKNMWIAKEKLRPIIHQPIYRNEIGRKVTKEEFEYFKGKK